MRHVASVFEPTYIVMDANDEDIIPMVSKKLSNRNIRSSGSSNINSNKIMIASSLEDDDNIYVPNDIDTVTTDNNNMTLISTMLETEKQVIPPLLLPLLLLLLILSPSLLDCFK